MRYFDKLIGNETSGMMFSRHIQNDTLAHAYLFEGPDGSGKEFFALQIMAAVGCQDADVRPCGKCPSCRKILSGQSADIRFIDADKGKTQITVDKIRAMKEDAVILPNDLDCKAYIIRSASRMNVQAQNALLKLLEEPPAGVYLFLLCEDRTALLPTILSRVETVRMQRFTPAELETFLQDDPNAQAAKRRDGAAYRTMLRLCDGAIGQAKERVGMTKQQAAADPRMKSYETARRILSCRLLEKRGGTALSGVLSEELTTREACAAVVTDLLGAVHDILIFKNGAEEKSLLFFTDADDCGAFADAISAREAASVFEKLTQIQKQSSANLNIAALLWRIGTL